MAFLNLSRDLKENVTISLSPKIKFVSSSAGITGSEYVGPLRSSRIKEIKIFDNDNISDGQLDANNTNPLYDESDQHAIENYAFTKQNLLNQPNVNSILPLADRYMAAANDANKEIKSNIEVSILRHEPPIAFSTGTVMKQHVQNVLMPYYQHEYDKCGFYYSNYNCLNFFTASNFNTGSVLIYPNIDRQYTNFGNNTTVPNHVSLQFWINPKYKNGSDIQPYHAGTVYHMSSSLALSLISGSRKDKDGLVDSYKILAQVGETAELSPDSINFNSRTAPNNLWVTSSFELSHNHWHHVTFRWSPSHYNGTGSLIIDNNETKFNFLVDSGSIIKSGVTDLDIFGICIGNFFSGEKNILRDFFNSNSKTSEGVYSFGSATYDPFESTYSFNNPLNAEVHEIKFYNSFVNNSHLNGSVYNTGSGVLSTEYTGDDSTIGGHDNYIPSPYSFGAPAPHGSVVPYGFVPMTSEELKLAEQESLQNYGSDKNLLFYLPVLYFPSSSRQEFIFDGTFKVTTSSFTPLNVPFAFSKNGKEINLQNFTLEYVKGQQPRHLFLTSSLTSDSSNADKYAYSTGSITKRNLTILPCDNGQFKPNYYSIERLISKSYNSGSLPDYFPKGFLGSGGNYHLIKIEDFVKLENSSAGVYSIDQIDPSMFKEIVGDFHLPTNTGIQEIKEKAQNSYANNKYWPLAIVEDLKDDASNFITFFDISNLYYGNAIRTNSFKLYEESLTGSQGKINITLRDNGRGSLYRADCLTKHALWNSVGNIFYNEGVAIIKSPHLPKIGKDKTAKLKLP